MVLAFAFLAPSWALCAASPTSSSRAPSSGTISPPYDFPQPFPVGDKQVTTSVVLRPIVPVYATPPAVLAVSAAPGTRFKISVPLADDAIASISWFKNGLPSGITATTLDLPSVGAGDGGTYGVSVTGIDGQAKNFENIILRIEASGASQRLVNLSTRATINSSQRFFISGFCVSSSFDNTSKSFLIRAVGPTLANYGITDPLADPEVHLYAADGTEVPFPPAVAIYPSYADNVFSLVGAFPLVSPKDVRVLFTLPPGVYTAKVEIASI